MIYDGLPPPHPPQPPRESTVIVFSMKFFIHTFLPSAPRQTANRNAHSRLFVLFLWTFTIHEKDLYSTHALFILTVFDFRSSSTNIFSYYLLFDENSCYGQNYVHNFIPSGTSARVFSLPLSGYVFVFASLYISCVFVAFFPNNFLLNVLTSSFLRETDSFLKITLPPIMFYVL